MKRTLRSVYLHEDTGLAAQLGGVLDMLAGKPEYVKAVRDQLLNKVKRSHREDAEEIVSLMGRYSKAQQGERQSLGQDITKRLEALPVEGNKSAGALLIEAAARGRKGFSLGFDGDIAGHAAHPISGFDSVTDQRWPEPPRQVNEDLEYEIGTYEATELVQKVVDLADELEQHAEKAADAGDMLQGKELLRCARDAQKLAAKLNSVLLLGEDLPM